jgi:hypothetical protein
MASAVKGLRVAYHKEGVDPCRRHAHYCECFRQRRGRPLGRLHNPHRPSLPRASPCPERSDRAADAHLKRYGLPSAAVAVAVTNGRLDFGTWERIFSSQVEWLAWES